MNPQRQQEFIEDTRLEARDRMVILEATLRGVRGMAETEATLNHSAAWAKAVMQIDEALK